MDDERKKLVIINIALDDFEIYFDFVAKNITDYKDCLEYLMFHVFEPMINSVLERFGYKIKDYEVFYWWSLAEGREHMTEDFVKFMEKLSEKLSEDELFCQGILYAEARNADALIRFYHHRGGAYALVWFEPVREGEGEEPL